jgi:hypothetical protein
LQTKGYSINVFYMIKRLHNIRVSGILLIVLLVSRVFAVTRRAELVNQKYQMIKVHWFVV